MPTRRLSLALCCLLMPAAVSAQPAAAWQESDSGASVNAKYVNPAGITPAQIEAARPAECSSKIDAHKLAQESKDAPYVPLSAGCKFNLFVRQAYSPYTFAGAGFQATWAQAMGQWPHYGGGMAGWGKRFGATLTDTESRRFIQGFALSTLLHQDPRYFPSHRNRIFPRVWYAATRVAVGRRDAGDSTFNSPEFLGALFASSLQNAYYPEADRTFGQTMGRFGGALSSDVVSNVLREFTPDIKSFFRRHVPAKVKSIERELPIPDEDKL